MGRKALAMQGKKREETKFHQGLGSDTKMIGERKEEEEEERRGAPSTK